MTPAELHARRALSVALERKTGYDSILTIEEMYRDYDRPGRYVCCFSECRTATRDAHRMWLHVHFSKKHGLSFGVADPADLTEVADDA